MAPINLSKVLTPTDVTSKFSWRASWLGWLPPFPRGANHVSFEAVDSNGKVWTFTCSVRKGGPYLKPALERSSWIPFVRDKGLAVNDLVIFTYNPDEDEPVKFRIRVKKEETVQLFGYNVTFHANYED